MKFVRRSAKYRPLDITVALVVMVFGIGQIFSKDELYWPWLLDAVSIYFIFGALITLAAIVSPDDEWPVQKFITEMFGWLFIASASAAMTITYFLASFASNNPDLIRDMTWFWVWLVVTIGATWRFCLMRSLYKGVQVG